MRALLLIAKKAGLQSADLKQGEGGGIQRAAKVFAKRRIPDGQIWPCRLKQRHA